MYLRSILTFGFIATLASVANAGVVTEDVTIPENGRCDAYTMYYDEDISILGDRAQGILLEDNPSFTGVREDHNSAVSISQLRRYDGVYDSDGNQCMIADVIFVNPATEQACYRTFCYNTRECRDLVSKEQYRRARTPISFEKLEGQDSLLEFSDQ